MNTLLALTSLILLVFSALLLWQFLEQKKMIAQILVALSLAAIAGCLFAGFRVSGASRRDLRILNTHRISARSAVQKSRMELLEVRNRAKLLEDTVSGGAMAVEKVHKAVRTTNRALHILADTLIIGKAEKRIVSKTKKAP